ncbi:hypothetical protein QFZ36_002714 [Pseudarthrobacter siccitolerans]|uniref:Uncharacterized protein n=1 Tax=Pseudarthrobacter siccitolerans TaxID=861266 RepID=A0ABU0PMI5_9MICC|nr:hypothetical protein [Pseudarthrobacter siccitolerans]MDQ0675153.1 hypothetical protein [Pseudarthrobacter siccitolerans]
MTTQLTVTAAPAAEASGAVPEVIASLPVSLHPAGADKSDLVAIDGSKGWTQAAEEAIRNGAKGLLVINPCPEDVTSLRDTAEGADVPVLVDSTWAYNPAVTAGKDAFTARNDADSLLETRINVPVGSDLERVLLGHLSLIRSAVDEVTDLRFVFKDMHGYEAQALLSSGARASLSAIASDSVPTSAYLRIIKPETAVETVLPGPSAAVPGKVTVSGPEGATLLETQWETAHRSAWRHLHRLVQDGASGTDLAGFARDVFTLRTAE